MEDYKQKSKAARLKVLSLIYKAQTSHIGCNFSCIDIMTVLFSKIDLDKDKFILGKGWAAAALYYFLYKKDRLSLKDLDSYCQMGSKYIGLAEPVHPDIPFAGGSIGMGLSAGVGYAYSKKLKGEEGIVYVLEGDGGMQCGINWEAIRFAAYHKLDNLVLIIDNNGFQGMGACDEVLGEENFMRQLTEFGWLAYQGDGHDFEVLDSTLTAVKAHKPFEPMPFAMIYNTIKGKGVSFMENNNLYHYKQLDDNEFTMAKKEINE